MSPWIFVTADDEELQNVLSGIAPPHGYPWPGMSRKIIRSGEIGVLLATDNSRATPPACLVVAPDASRRLFGRYSQLRSDLSPLSAWTHILDWRQFELLKDNNRVPQLAGFEAAWIGLAVAEALMLYARPLAQLRVAACLSTASYALARSLALWPNESVATVLSRFDSCHQLVRSAERSSQRLRGALMEIWEILSDLSNPLPRNPSPSRRAISNSLKALKSARERDQNEENSLLDHLNLPQWDRLREIGAMPAERRLKEFDLVVNEINTISADQDHQKTQLFFLAGYIATIAAGGSPSLALAEQLAGRYPQITAWAYIIGGIGERVTWTSAFDGLGRLLARELQRPFRLDEGPCCDFALSEASVLVDPALQDPLVHLRVKQARIMTVALLPGVNVTVPLAEPPGDSKKAYSRGSTEEASNPGAHDPMRLLARALAPYLLDEIGRPQSLSQSSYPRARSRSKGYKNQPLPFNEE